MAEQPKQTLPSFAEEMESSCCQNDSCCGSQAPVKREFPKVGRNDPCPCGSGRKFKKCCGQA